MSWFGDRRRKQQPWESAFRSLENKMQAELLKQGMQIDALLRFCGNKVEKNPVEFHTEPERVEVQRRKSA